MASTVCLRLALPAIPQSLVGTHLTPRTQLRTRLTGPATWRASRVVRSQFRDEEKERSSAQWAQEAGEKVKSSLKGSSPREDGIFATSGTMGFTKRNELFVGRMAMLGFAAACIGEAWTGTGPLGQLSIETGIPVQTAPPLLLVFILTMIFGAFTDVGMGSKGYKEADPQQPAKSLAQWDLRGMIGLPKKGPFFGFTRPVEYLNGRVAQVGFAACLLGEIATGKGPVGQLSIETGIPVPVFIAVLLFVVPFVFVSLVNLEAERALDTGDY